MRFLLLAWIVDPGIFRVEERSDLAVGKPFAEQRKACLPAHVFAYSGILPFQYVVVVVLAKPDDIGLADVLDDLLRGERIVEHLLLQQPQKQDGRIAGQEMSPYPVVRACIRRSCGKLCLHHPERPFDVPEPVVYAVDLAFLHAEFGCDEYIVSAETEVMLQLLLVSGKGDLDIFEDLAGLLVDRADGDHLCILPSDSLLYPCGRGFPCGLFVLSDKLDRLLLLQGRIERCDPLLLPLEPDGLPFCVLVFIFIDIADALVAVGDLAVLVQDIRPSVLIEHPFQVIVRHHLRRFGEDVSVVCSASPDVLRTVQSLVCHLYYPGRLSLLLPYPVQGARKVRLLAFVSREDLHLVGYDVGIQHQRHGYDGIGPVLLGRAFPAYSGFAVDLEVIVGAVEIDFVEIPSEVSVDGGVQYVDDVLNDRSEIGDPGIHLAYGGDLPGRVFVHEREDLRKRLPLGARIDDAGVGQRENGRKNPEIRKTFFRKEPGFQKFLLLISKRR